MCGIAGIFASNKHIAIGHVIKDMLRVIKHRGPDDEGYLAIDINAHVETPLVGRDSVVSGKGIDDFLNSGSINLFLGHRRLSIIDLSEHGHQPMSNTNRTLWIVYNGEIYNYIELRDELAKYGYHFNSKTDTEVVIASYEIWGMDCVNKFNGMWSFVIYDKEKGILFGSRDRFGVKPMYYAIGCDFFAFASEIKSLLNIPSIKKTVNRDLIFDYLVLGWEERGEETVFNNIYELMPAHSFAYDIINGQMKRWRYYELSLSDEWEDFDEHKAEEHAERIRCHFINAVKLRLRSDVPIGSCLSGGLDSSSIVCTIHNSLRGENRKQVGHNQSVFTACYEHPCIDERLWAKRVVDLTGADWNQVFPTSKEFLSDIERIVYFQDMPFGSSSIYAQYRVMKLVRERGVNVLLDGQGGDELFGGYESSTRAFYLEMLKAGHLRKIINEYRNIVRSNLNGNEVFRPLVKTYINHLMPNNVRRRLYRYSHAENRYINPALWRTLHHRIDQIGEQSVFSLNNQLYDLMTTSNLKVLLRYEDRNSMCFSVESRTPFADDIELIEYAFRLPSVYKIYGGVNKYILKRAMVDILPTEILQRSNKIGFETPERGWLQDGAEQLKAYFNDAIADVIDVPKILKDWPAMTSNQGCYGRTNLWRFINYAVWHKVFFQ